jgi:hypothetical protein
MYSNQLFSYGIEVGIDKVILLENMFGIVVISSLGFL